MRFLWISQRRIDRGTMDIEVIYLNIFHCGLFSTTLLLPGDDDEEGRRIIKNKTKEYLINNILWVIQSIGPGSRSGSRLNVTIMLAGGGKDHRSGGWKKRAIGKERLFNSIRYIEL